MAFSISGAFRLAAIEQHRRALAFKQAVCGLIDPVFDRFLVKFVEFLAEQVLEKAVGEVAQKRVFTRNRQNRRWPQPRFSPQEPLVRVIKKAFERGRRLVFRLPQIFGAVDFEERAGAFFKCFFQKNGLRQLEIYFKPLPVGSRIEVKLELVEILSKNSFEVAHQQVGLHVLARYFFGGNKKQPPLRPQDRLDLPEPVEPVLPLCCVKLDAFFF